MEDSKSKTNQLTGSRADIIIADDVESWTNSQTQTMRESMLKRMDKYHPEVLVTLCGSKEYKKMLKENKYNLTWFEDGPSHTKKNS